MCRHLPTFFGIEQSPSELMLPISWVASLDTCLARSLFKLETLQYRQLHLLQAAPLTIVVEVLNCTKGQFNLTAEQCSSCTSNTYNLDASKQCNQCPERAQCFGGATIVPRNANWHSAAESDNIVGCPNSNACQRNITALGICQRAAYSRQLASNLSQV